MILQHSDVQELRFLSKDIQELVHKPPPWTKGDAATLILVAARLELLAAQWNHAYVHENSADA